MRIELDTGRGARVYSGGFYADVHRVEYWNSTDWYFGDARDNDQRHGVGPWLWLRLEWTWWRRNRVAKRAAKQLAKAAERARRASWADERNRHWKPLPAGLPAARVITGGGS